MTRKTSILLLALPLTALVVTIALLAPSPRVAKAVPQSAALSTSLLFECLPDNTVRVVFRWASTGEGVQWLDMSVNGEDFEPGSYLGLGPIPPGQGYAAWDGLVPGVWHHVRVNTLTSEGWAPSLPMLFSTPTDCPFGSAPRPAFSDPQDCPGMNRAGIAGCVWTPKADYGSFSVGERVDYCYALNQPADIRIVANRPDGTSFLVVDGYVSGPSACIGPYSAGTPFGLRSVSMYAGDNLLLSETHFYVR